MTVFVWDWMTPWERVCVRDSVRVYVCSCLYLCMFETEGVNTHRNVVRGSLGRLLPMHHAGPMKVLDCHDELLHVFLRLALFQTLLLIDVVHEVAAGAQLHHQVVAVLRLQDVQQLGDVGVANHLLDLALAAQVLGYIGVLLGFSLVDHFYCHLRIHKICYYLIYLATPNDHYQGKTLH